MKLLSRIGATTLAASLCLQQCVAQMTAGNYTDPATGIKLKTWTATDGGAFTFGLALPSDALTKDATEYIGLLRCEIANATSPGWCGISHGQSGQMTQALLLVAWQYNGTVYTSFRYATGYTLPGLYTGNAKLTQISTNITATSYELLYRCQNCFSWDQDGTSGNVSTSSGSLVLGHAAAKQGLENPTCPDKATFGFHDNGYGQWGAPLDGAAQASYSTWTALATKTPPNTCDGSGNTQAQCKPAPSATYDYIVVGAGAGGIPVADKLSQAGHKVLLIEKGPPSTGQWNGTMGPDWLKGTGLTRFDVPGLCNEIWVNSAGVACTDTDQMAGCVLGGGTAVNAGLWWKPNPLDWDENFPDGWKSTDLADATSRVFSRIPGTWHPSMDGKLYRQEGFDVLSGGLSKSGWKSVVPNDAPTEKNHTFGHSTFMFSGGERGGPLATYLATAYARPNFSLWTGTAVRRAVRNGSEVTGVELECLTDGGYNGTVKLNPKGGVIFSAGTFGSAKLLFRSGIGPSDQLEVIASSKDGATFSPKSDWINLPVGYNLMDHLNTDLIITHPDVVFYDFYQAWDSPIPADENSYLKNRTGILAQAAPNIGPMMWDQVTPSDGIVRQLQWTCRVEGDSHYTNSTHAMTLSQYLGRGVVSRGRMTISPGLATVVSTAPYLHNDGDLEAVIQGIKNVQNALNIIPNLTWVLPPPNGTVEDYVNGLLVTPSARRSNHWMGTAKIGTDDGRQANGSAVVDLNTRVYGTDNLFVVDASIFPGMPTGNPSAMIVIAAEQAATKILALRS
ncbi:06cbdded-7847-4769-a7b4-f9d23bb02f56 [Thermothielavioides terrestris]|uniref:Cellobiose dehydrogenase n=2 Tax=Thermothielavioides terrestris TaxID=2587410 RepID=G2QV06_THETT|nr:cellobiose dehydrogenase [Thermothielavioides terrestris NRRL 8126]AEO64604.1 cellobiose dehydrogenase [Thermothielavioides terrestris NRRL 8126]SPQ26547.1 06cbdded-7847-4769-a7b4-f9d23bb02f56 [Thermothielavioides terrestris]